MQQRIIQFCGFSKASLLFMYLLVPITSKRLTIADCDVLVDRILSRISCWSSRNLSYATRNVLVTYVLLSIHTYWSQVFMLPKGMLLKIIQICRAFLWEGKSYLHKLLLFLGNGCLNLRTKVVWEYEIACCRTMLLWVNKPGRLLKRMIHFGSDGYIVSILGMLIGGSIIPPGNASWTWKLIYRVRYVFKDACHNNNWLDGTKVYSVKEGYKWLRGVWEGVKWHNWVWNPVNISKHACIS